MIYSYTNIYWHIQLHYGEIFLWSRMWSCNKVVHAIDKNFTTSFNSSVKNSETPGFSTAIQMRNRVYRKFQSSICALNLRYRSERNWVRTKQTCIVDSKYHWYFWDFVIICSAFLCLFRFIKNIWNWRNNLFRTFPS